jgi:hypothetical protein
MYYFRPVGKLLPSTIKPALVVPFGNPTKIPVLEAFILILNKFWHPVFSSISYL